jgi:CheY-like chemotaxis protein
MSRILLVDDSPHAQRIGERILSDEGYEVVTVSNADSALIRLDDVDPDVVVADTVMPGRTGYEICQYIKMSPRHRHVRVILTAGVLEPMDEARVRQVDADGTLKKPFEATALLSSVKPLADAAAAARASADPGAAAHPAEAHAPRQQVPFIAVVDAEQVRAAVTVALDAAMESMVDEISRRVLAALHTRKQEGETPALSLRAADEPAAAKPRPIALEEPHPAPPAPAVPHMEPIRRVTPLRLRSGSLLGLDLGRAEREPERPPAPAAAPPPVAEPETFSAEAAPAPLQANPPEPSLVPSALSTKPPAEPPAEMEPDSSQPSPARPQPRISLLRSRSGSILGLDLYAPDPEESSSTRNDS